MKKADDINVTMTEASRILGVTVDYLYKEARSQRIPASKVNKTWQVPLAYIQQRKVKE